MAVLDARKHGRREMGKQKRLDRHVDLTGETGPTREKGTQYTGEISVTNST